MKKAVLFIVCAMGMVSCGNRTVKENIYVCNCEQQKLASKFVSDNIKNANNMSDEEMEEVVHQLERTSIRLNCPKKRVTVIQSHEGWTIDVIGLKKGETSYEEY